MLKQNSSSNLHSIQRIAITLTKMVRCTTVIQEACYDYNKIKHKRHMLDSKVDIIQLQVKITFVRIQKGEDTGHKTSYY